WHQVGPPLSVRTMTATADGAAVLVNVHVGGIPRSVDGGVTWHPTIAVDDDVHQVLAHPTRPEIAVAAASVGLCRSTDGGATWTATWIREASAATARSLHSPTAKATCGDQLRDSRAPSASPKDSTVSRE